MTRAFDDTEKRTVTEALLDSGEELFGKLGFAKTAVEDITRDAGVAKGTFYTFWPSKEAFFFSCLERAEIRFQNEVVNPAFERAAHPAEALGRLISETFSRLGDYPLIRTALDIDLIRRLSRKLPQETLERHQQIDRNEFREITSSWDSDVFDPGISPEVFDGIFKGLIMMSLHRDIIGEDIYEEVAKTMSEVMSAGLKTLSDERKRRGAETDQGRKKKTRPKTQPAGQQPDKRGGKL